jgi:uncharacterized protein YndB with AHSA1/START domain
MRGMNAPSRTSVSKIIAAPPEAIYRAFLDPEAITAWLPPDIMRGVMHAFEPREGGAFSMTLLYPDGDTSARGKTSAKTDTFGGRVVKLIPNQQIVWAVRFESADRSFAGEMTVRWTLVPDGRGPAISGTQVIAECENIPPGIRLEDNEAGSRATLEKLAAFVGG